MLLPTRAFQYSLLLTICIIVDYAQAGHLHRHIGYRRAINGAHVSSDSLSIQLAADVKDLKQQFSTFSQDVVDFLSYISNREQQVDSVLGISDTSAIPLPTPWTGERPTKSSARIIASTASRPVLTTASGTATSDSSADSTPSATANPTGTKAFDPRATDIVAVYYGQTADTSASGLQTLCEDPNINIVNLAFVPTFFTEPSGYPTTSFGPACTTPDSAQSLDAPSLQDCTLLGQQIKQCQARHNTKILVSLGGYIASSSFASDAQAKEFAKTLWDLFGGGSGLDSSLRPFGPDVVVDGFDIDNEDHSTAHWPAFAQALRKLYVTDRTKKYYIGAAPQCPRPDQSISLGVLRSADFVWVQFYNNPSCQLDTGEVFLDSIAAWEKDLHYRDTSGTGKPRLLIGMGAWPGAGEGFVEAESLDRIMEGVKKRLGRSLGGIMLWDGTVGESNGYVEAAKAALS